VKNLSKGINTNGVEIPADGDHGVGMGLLMGRPSGGVRVINYINDNVVPNLKRPQPPQSQEHTCEGQVPFVQELGKQPVCDRNGMEISNGTEEVSMCAGKTEASAALEPDGGGGGTGMELDGECYRGAVETTPLASDVRGYVRTALSRVGCKMGVHGWVGEEGRRELEAQADRLRMELLAQQAGRSPIPVRAEGNCLYESLSLCMHGTREHASCLRSKHHEVLRGVQSAWARWGERTNILRKEGECWVKDVEEALQATQSGGHVVGLATLATLARAEQLVVTVCSALPNEEGDAMMRESFGEEGLEVMLGHQHDHVEPWLEVAAGGKFKAAGRSCSVCAGVGHAEGLMEAAVWEQERRAAGVYEVSEEGKAEADRRWQCRNLLRLVILEQGLRTSWEDDAALYTVTQCMNDPSTAAQVLNERSARCLWGRGWLEQGGGCGAAWAEVLDAGLHLIRDLGVDRTLVVMESQALTVNGRVAEALGRNAQGSGWGRGLPTVWPPALTGQLERGGWGVHHVRVSHAPPQEMEEREWLVRAMYATNLEPLVGGRVGLQHTWEVRRTGGGAAGQQEGGHLAHQVEYRVLARVRRDAADAYRRGGYMQAAGGGPRVAAFRYEVPLLGQKGHLIGAIANVPMWDQSALERYAHAVRALTRSTLGKGGVQGLVDVAPKWYEWTSGDGGGGRVQCRRLLLMVSSTVPEMAAALKPLLQGAAARARDAQGRALGPRVVLNCDLRGEAEKLPMQREPPAPEGWGWYVHLRYSGELAMGNVRACANGGKGEGGCTGVSSMTGRRQHRYALVHFRDEALAIAGAARLNKGGWEATHRTAVMEEEWAAQGVSGCAGGWEWRPRTPRGGESRSTGGGGLLYCKRRCVGDTGDGPQAASAGGGGGSADAGGVPSYDGTVR
jgi:hypothetical protein